MSTVAAAATSALPAPPTAPKDSFGCVSSRLRKDQQFRSAGLAFYRKCMDDTEIERVAMPASERGFLIGISLRGGHRRKIFSGMRTDDRRFDAHSIYIRDFSDNYSADLYGNFDFLLVEMSARALTQFGDETDAPAIDGLTCAARQHDPVLGHLGAALATAADMQGELNERFAEQLGVTIGSHLAGKYGNLRGTETRIKGQLSRAHEARAKELLLMRTREGASIADIARECNLSRSYFIRAFARSTGRTPHQWLLDQRTDQARGLIESSTMTLAEIALACGFSDQSHLSRVFARTLGVTPGAWRRGADN
ncbi:AraC family transcriptional regulator [Burkholderia sp. Ac-20379]|uniref:AraC family transcriptional regulator n=1 Tax=Burkholderia sp. Ac-20379 TaxID=2703900 RepID=UPI001982116A|nr:AraC family transcriptional regulator [Burkholderia sp. Ac-20379]MBN3728597.1 helix-turn-helix transcriptional regulator [Burkholderia sp. Ac-20379]